jgi:hypothetical protein
MPNQGDLTGQSFNCRLAFVGENGRFPPDQDRKLVRNEIRSYYKSYNQNGHDLVKYSNKSKSIKQPFKEVGKIK